MIHAWVGLRHVVDSHLNGNHEILRTWFKGQKLGRSDVGRAVPGRWRGLGGRVRHCLDQRLMLLKFWGLQGK